MKTALITGGLGFIGSFIARNLVEKEIVQKVVLVDHYGRYVDSTRADFVDYRNLRIKGIENSVVVERGESRNFGVMHKLLEAYRPEYIFHLAALPLAKLQNINTLEAQEGSVLSTSNMLESARMLMDTSDYKLKRFIYASSSMVYGDFQTKVATEDHPVNPKEVYGTMKLAGEVVTRGLSKAYGIDSTIIRPSAVYGPTDMNRRVTQIFIEKALAGQKIKVQGADEALDFTYVKDTAKGFVLAATKDEAIGHTFNITHGKAHRLIDFVNVLQNHFPDLEYEIAPRDSDRPKRGTLSIDKARQLLGYEPDYDLSSGISEYLDFFKKHHPIYSKNVPAI